MMDNDFDPMEKKESPSTEQAQDSLDLQTVTPPAEEEVSMKEDATGHTTPEESTHMDAPAEEPVAEELSQTEPEKTSAPLDEDEDLTNFYNFHPGYSPAPNGRPPKSSGNGSLAVVLVCVAVFISLLGLAVVGIFGLGFDGLSSLTGSSPSDSSHNTSSDPSGDVSSGSSVGSSDGSHSYSSGDLDLILGSVASSTENQAGVLVAQKVTPSIVGVLTYEEYRGEYEMVGSGSGIILSKDGFIVTNQHVIEGADKVAVTLYSDNGMNEEDSYIAEVVGEDSTTDIALLKIDATNLTPAEFADSSQILVGETVFAVGNPGGLELSSSISQGLISGVNRNLGNTSLIQTDVAINPGNSGGALVNVYGQVIGITSEKIVSVSSVSAEGLGFAIPSNVAAPIIEELLAHGYVTGRVALKVTIRVYSDALAQMEGLPEDCRLMVDSVEEGSHAQEAGVKSGLFVTHFNGVSVSTLDDLKAQRDLCKAGDTVTLTLYNPNSKKSKDVSFVLEEDRG